MYRLTVCLVDGQVLSERVVSLDRARSIAARVAKDGYCVDNGDRGFKHYPPHRIVRVDAAPELVVGCEVRFWRTLDPTPYVGRLVGVDAHGGKAHVEESGLAAAWVVDLSSVTTLR